jgi:hypothetical protein
LKKKFKKCLTVKNKDDIIVKLSIAEAAQT